MAGMRALAVQRHIRDYRELSPEWFEYTTGHGHEWRCAGMAMAETMAIMAAKGAAFAAGMM
jgi:hypothetical protein